MKELGDHTINKLRPQEFPKMDQFHSGNKISLFKIIQNIKDVTQTTERKEQH